MPSTLTAYLLGIVPTDDLKIFGVQQNTRSFKEKVFASIIAEIYRDTLVPLHPPFPPVLMNFPAYARLFFALLLHPSLDPLSSYCNRVKLFMKEYSHFPLCQFFLTGLCLISFFSDYSIYTQLIFHLFTPKDYTVAVSSWSIANNFVIDFYCRCLDILCQIA